MPQGYVTKNFVRLDEAYRKGYTTASLQGSSRSSKTYSNVQWLIRMCYETPGTTVSIVRKTMPALKRSVYRDFQEIMIDWGLWNDRQMNKSEFVYTFGNGSWIEFFSCEDEQKLRGSKRQILFVNEANEISFLEWQQLQMRTTAFSIIDYNPSFSEEHWINQVNLEKRTHFWISTYKDNPFLEQKVIDEIESLQWKNKSLWQVYGLGQRAVVEGLVFPKFDIIDHIPREATRHRYVGMDLGYSNDSTAIVEVCFWKDAMYLNQLCYKTHMLTSDIIRELKGIDWQPEIISESADPRMVDEIYNAGLDIKAVHKYAGSINAGLMKMKEYRICVTRQSSDLIKEFRNYTYRQDKEGKWLSEPIDAFNHCFVGETLVITENEEKRIDSLKIGELVLTSYGFRRISKFFNNGIKNVIRLRISFIGGKTVEIEGTPDHKVKTTNGWIELQNLSVGNTLYISDEADIRKIAISRIEILSRRKEQVYDIEVEEAHEFFANGILVHNCIDATRYVVLEKILGGYGSGMSASEILGIVG